MIIDQHSIFSDSLTLSFNKFNYHGIWTLFRIKNLNNLGYKTFKLFNRRVAL